MDIIEYYSNAHCGTDKALGKVMGMLLSVCEEAFEARTEINVATRLHAILRDGAQVAIHL